MLRHAMVLATLLSACGRAGAAEPETVQPMEEERYDDGDEPEIVEETDAAFRLPIPFPIPPLPFPLPLPGGGSGRGPSPVPPQDQPAPAPAPLPTCPSPVPTPAPAPAPDKAQEVVREINAKRAARGLRPVTYNAALSCATTRHARDIGERRSCSHTGSDGSQPGARAQACNAPGWSGEIVACGQTSPAEAVKAWEGSPGHARIMLDGGQTQVGVSMHKNYWVALFTKN